MRGGLTIPFGWLGAVLRTDTAKDMLRHDFSGELPPGAVVQYVGPADGGVHVEWEATEAPPAITPAEEKPKPVILSLGALFSGDGNSGIRE